MSTKKIMINSNEGAFVLKVMRFLKSNNNTGFSLTANMLTDEQSLIPFCRVNDADITINNCSNEEIGEME